MPFTFATRAIALVSLFSLAAANPKPVWKRQVADNSTAPFTLSTGAATTTYTTLVTLTPTDPNVAPQPTLEVLTCTDDIIAAGLSAEPVEAASFCSSFIGIPAITVTTNGITTTVTTTSITTGTITSTTTSTTPCATTIATVTTILSTPPAARRDALPITARAVLPDEHPFMKLERQASDELNMNDCSTLLSTFSNDCSCLFLPTQTTTVCGTTTFTFTQRETVRVLTTTAAFTCAGTSTITSTQTLVVYTQPTTTSVSTVPPTSIPTTPFTNTTTPAETSTPTTSPVLLTTTPVDNTTTPVTIASTSPTSSGGAETQNSTFTIPPFPTTSGEGRIGTITETLPGLTVTDTFTIPQNGTTVTLGGTTITYPAITTTTTEFVTETVTPIPGTGSTGIIPPPDTSSAPFTWDNGTTSTAGPTAPLTTGPTSSSGAASTGVIPPVNTTSAPYTYTNGTAPATTPFVTGPSSGFSTTSANFTIPPFSIGNETRSGDFPTGTAPSTSVTSAPFPNGNDTTTAPSGSLVTGTAPATPTSNPYFQQNQTLTFNGTFTTTYTTLVTSTAVQVFNATVTTEYRSVVVSVSQYGSASTTVIVGPTIYPSGSTGPLYSEPVPSDYTVAPGSTSAADTFITAPTPTPEATSAPVKRWGRVRKQAPRADML